MISKRIIWILALGWLWLGVSFYPKWKKTYSEAAISWDVSGYYHYLPAIFIYHDLRQQHWIHAINEKYLPSPAYDQAFGHVNSGNKVNKYAIGQAVLYSPFFLAAHVIASNTGSWPADGYSRPYQFAIWFGSFCVSVLGLILLRNILLRYVSDIVATLTLIALAWGTHWMEYASITNGMNHTWLFTLLCALILSVIRFNEQPGFGRAACIGVFLGLGALTRPTEIIWALIPLMWGMTSISSRFAFLWNHRMKVILAVFLTGLIGFVQLAYWKYAAGEWIVYSYGEQGFNWFNPNIWRGLMGVNLGWWPYTPMMLVAMGGWVMLYRQHRVIFWPVMLCSALALYITLSWAHFESGGGLGQRNMIQAYPLLAFPLAMVVQWFLKTRIRQWIWYAILVLNVYYSAWWVFQAHRGGLFYAGQMTTPYFYSIAGRLYPEKDFVKLLDTKEYFKGKANFTADILQDDFQQDSSAQTAFILGQNREVLLSKDQQVYGPVELAVNPACGHWIRLEADFTIHAHEWETWKQTQWIVQFHQGGEVIKTNLIRVHRIISQDNVSTHVFFDVRLPDQPFSSCTMQLWNGGSDKPVSMDNLRVRCFRTK